jgi:hypothetical protein
VRLKVAKHPSTVLDATNTNIEAHTVADRRIRRQKATYLEVHKHPSLVAETISSAASLWVGSRWVAGRSRHSRATHLEPDQLDPPTTGGREYYQTYIKVECSKTMA